MSVLKNMGVPTPSLYCYCPDIACPRKTDRPTKDKFMGGGLETAGCGRESGVGNHGNSGPRRGHGHGHGPGGGRGHRCGCG